MARKRRKKNNSGLARVGGGWKGKTRDGDVMVSILVNVGDLQDYLDNIDFENLESDSSMPMMLFVNGFKKKKKHPDFNLYGVDPSTRDDYDEDEEDDLPRRRRRKKKKSKKTRKPKKSRRRRKEEEEEETEEFEVEDEDSEFEL